MAVPWRAAEAMHWQLGELEMARRAGVTPFALSAVSLDNQHGASRASPRGHGHSQSHGSVPREHLGHARGYSRGIPAPPAARPLATRREHIPPPHVPVQPEHPESFSYGHPGSALAPINTMAQQRGPAMLPGVAELTTGVSPFSTPAYSASVPSASPGQSSITSPGPFPPALAYAPPEAAGSKRRRSPDMMTSESSRRRHLEPGTEPPITRHGP
jgi:hypothetical protein